MYIVLDTSNIQFQLQQYLSYQIVDFQSRSYVQLSAI